MIFHLSSPNLYLDILPYKNYYLEKNVNKIVV